MDNTGLTKREMQIMNVLWNSGAPMSAHDIFVQEPELSRNTIQIVLKKLQTIGFIEVAGFAYNKNALTRTFRPSVAQSEYVSTTLAPETTLQLTRQFIRQCDSVEELEALSDLIDEKRRELSAQ